jgi:hypothetical protein
LCALALAACIGCQEKGDTENDELLAQVFQHKLYSSDVERVLTSAYSPEDSLMLLRNYVENWVRDALLLHEAEKQLPEDINIDKLVKNYRSSLILHNYEKHLVEERIDSTIQEAELMAYYEENKTQYQLETTIVRCRFMKIRKPVLQRDSLRKWWESDKNEDFAKLVRYNNENAEIFILDTSWYKVEEIAQLMPEGTISSENIRSTNTLRFTDDQFEYYLRVFETVQKKEIAPLSYIREQAIRVIMHQRKLDLLESIKSDLYKEELSKNNVKINI